MMSEALVDRLRKLADTDLGAMAVLRRSLAFDPGAWPQAYAYVERFVCGENVSRERRQAAYLVAGLFAMHRQHADGVSLGKAFGILAGKRQSGSIEQRFLNLLAADEDLLPDRLRRTLSLLKAEGVGLDYSRLLQDLTYWNTPDRTVQQRWARDFYRSSQESETTQEG